MQIARFVIVIVASAPHTRIVLGCAFSILYWLIASLESELAGPPPWPLPEKWAIDASRQPLPAKPKPVWSRSLLCGESLQFKPLRCDWFLVGGFDRF